MAFIGERVTRTPLGTIQAPPPVEHLEPERSPFLMSPKMAQYRQNVANFLLRSDVMTRRDVASMVCLPSFEAEWAVRLVLVDNVPTLLLVSEAASSLWYSSDPAAVAVEDRQVTLSADLGGKILEVWRQMLLGVRHPQHKWGGLDGVSYHFTCRGKGGFMSGWTWSPEEHTAPGKLVSLSHTLRKLAQAPVAATEGLVATAQEQLEWFK